MKYFLLFLLALFLLTPSDMFAQSDTPIDYSKVDLWEVGVQAGGIGHFGRYAAFGQGFSGQLTCRPVQGPIFRGQLTTNNLSGGGSSVDVDFTEILGLFAIGQTLNQGKNPLDAFLHVGGHGTFDMNIERHEGVYKNGGYSFVVGASLEKTWSIGKDVRAGIGGQASLLLGENAGDHTESQTKRGNRALRENTAWRPSLYATVTYNFTKLLHKKRTVQL